jgi:hydroxyacylglutathione hydrolase
MENVTRDIAPGIVLVMAEDQICNTWLLVHDKSCFIVDTPPKADDGTTVPADLVIQYIEDNDLTPVGVTITHHHFEHIDGIAGFWDNLSGSDTCKWICHESLLQHEPRLKPFFDTVFQQPVFESNVSGEPLFLIHAPKHSLSDVLVIFRGTMITGDWWLGEGDPNLNHVDSDLAIASIDLVLETLKTRNYWVHRLFPSQKEADQLDLRRDQDIDAVLLATRRFHET